MILDTALGVKAGQRQVVKGRGLQVDALLTTAAHCHPMSPKGA